MADTHPDRSRPERIWTAALVVIGDEILSGRTQDKNVAQIAQWLNVQGIRLAEVRVVADDTAAINAAIRPYSIAVAALLSTRYARATTMCSPPAASGRRTTTSPSMRSRRRWGWAWSTIPTRWRCWRTITPPAAA